MILSKRTRWSNFGKKISFWIFFSDKSSHYKTYDFRKFLIPDLFKHVQLQNTFNGCKILQILPLMVDYACFLVKCINYQNLMCIQKIHFLQDLAKFVQVKKILYDFCDTAVSYKNLTRMPLHPRILQELNFLWESCKIFLTCKNRARFCKK